MIVSGYDDIKIKEKGVSYNGKKGLITLLSCKELEDGSVFTLLS